MLRFTRSNDPVWFDFETRGAKIRLAIRPADAEFIQGIREKHKRTEYVKDPDTRRMVKVDTYREDKILDELTDHLIADFEGIGDENGNPLPVTLENKKRIMNIPPIAGEQSIVDFVFEKAKEIAVVAVDAVNNEIKNS
jgi:hypothetical protein